MSCWTSGRPEDRHRLVWHGSRNRGFDKYLYNRALADIWHRSRSLKMKAWYSTTMASKVGTKGLEQRFSWSPGRVTTYGLYKPSSWTLYNVFCAGCRPEARTWIWSLWNWCLLFALLTPLAHPAPSGTSLWTLLDTLRRHQHAYPQIDIKYDPDTSATTPVVVHIRPHLDLLFSGKHQRLHTICVRKLRDPNPPVTVQYKDHVLSSPQEILRRSGVSKVFGPTYPGDELRYPGLWFSFDEDGLGEGLKVPHAGDRMQEVRRIVISQIDPGGKTYDALDEVNECAAMAGELARAVVKVSLFIWIYYYPHRF